MIKLLAAGMAGIFAAYYEWLAKMAMKQEAACLRKAEEASRRSEEDHD